MGITHYNVPPRENLASDPTGHSGVVARKLRVQYPGAIYHVMNRGDHREAIFRSTKDREVFHQTLGRACQKTDWQVHAYLKDKQTP